MAFSDTNDGAHGEKTIGQWLALVLGVAFTLAGIAGFFVTGFDNFASNTDKTLFGLEVNPLHNIVHLALGVLGLVMWRRPDTARTYGWLTFLGYGGVFLYGLVATGNDDPNLLSINNADNVFHATVSILGLVTALTAFRRTGATTTSTSRDRTSTRS